MIQNFVLRIPIASVKSYSRIAVNLDSELLSKLENRQIKPKRHPGTQSYGEIVLPQRIQNSILKCIGDYPIKNLMNDGKKLCQYITARHAPIEQNIIQTKMKKLDKMFPVPKNINEMDNVEQAVYYNNRKIKIQNILKRQIYAWKPLKYGKYEALVYAVGRSALEFTILSKILSEIKQIDCNFKPRSFFDFGSGVGSGMWATSNIWQDSIFEYYNVDASKDMNDLADLILRDGNDNQQSNLKNVVFRQFLPAKEIQYDIIISSFSLFELNCEKDRLDVLLNLWKKCANYLVIVEEGTRNGFELVTEARDFLLKADINNPELSGHIVSPCPHQFDCPRLANQSDRTPCNFQIQYEPLSLLKKKGNRLNHLYSYLVLKKGHRPDNVGCLDWPRIVRSTLVRTRHTVCRLCTADGKLQEIIFTPSKHGKLTYQCARSSKWGDKLPIYIDNKEKV